MFRSPPQFPLGLKECPAFPPIMQAWSNSPLWLLQDTPWPEVIFDALSRGSHPHRAVLGKEPRNSTRRVTRADLSGKWSTNEQHTAKARFYIVGKASQTDSYVSQAASSGPNIIHWQGSGDEDT